MNIQEITETLIKYQTTADNPKALEDCLGYIANIFKGSELIVNKYEKNGKPSIVIATHDTRNFDIIMNGHIDVVSASKKEFEPKIKGNKLYGRGAGDMKGSDAVMLQIMREIDNWHEKPKVALMLTSDEEIGGFDGVKYLLEEEKYSAKCVLIPDGGNNMQPCHAQKGILHINVKAKGISAHGSRPWLGDNALDKLIQIYHGMKERYPLPEDKNRWKTTVNLGKLEGGNAANQIPDKAEMLLDIRYSETVTREEVLDNLQELCDKNKGSSWNIKVDGSSLYTAPNNKYLKLLVGIIESVTNKEAPLSKEHGGSDGRYFSEKGMPVILVKGNCSETHIENEWVDLDSLSQLKIIFTQFLKTFG